jgi:glycerol-3-phosphate acyltransferase PlsX
MKIAVDAMGGDYAPDEIVLGAIEAAREYRCDIILVGDETRIRKILDIHGANNLPIIVHHASEVIEMTEHPSIAIRKKKDASIVVATRLVKEGKAEVVISAGSTGAAVAAALLGLGRIPGIERPTIATPIPNLTGTTVLVDSGANVDCKPKHLFQNAVMGAVYAEKILGIPNPRVGLLNIGEEENKGNELVLDTYPLLKQAEFNFIGNVEGRDIPKGTVDVVVCDGFVGNVVLKFGEGLATAILILIKQAIAAQNWFIKMIAALVLPTALRGLKKKIDYAEYGGAPLLGVDGGFIISHGSSKAKAIKNSIRVARDLAEKRVVEKIRQSFSKDGELYNG